MTMQNAQETLNRILADLKSGDETRELAALRELEATDFSSEAILLQLEKLASNASGAVQKSALEALSLKTNQFVASNLSSLPKYDRGVILKEIDKWRNAGLLDEELAEIISRRYDFDLKPGIPIKTVTLPRVDKPEPMVEPELAQPAASTPAPAATALAPSPAAPPLPFGHDVSAKPAESRPSLTQVLLSETSIRIYLYLGAFFVIAAAAILAALVEAARLPILLIATVAFAGGAIGFKKRLPQPSFAFAIVFSFLLPIDANVIADNLNLSARGGHGYWSAIFLVMAFIWGFGTWFYGSRMFSLAAFAALALGFLRLVGALELTTSWSLLSAGFSSLAGLTGVRLLRNWKSQPFAQPLFLAAQLMQILTLVLSFNMVGINLFVERISANGWIAHTLIWLFAASFYTASGILFPFVLFPWMSAAALFPVPLLLLTAFDASATAFIAGFGVWGALMAFASEAARRVKRPEAGQYHLPLLVLSLPLFLVSITWGLIENATHGFAAFLGTAITYTLLNVFRPRWYVWTTALLAGLGAYFTFFALPFMRNTEVFFGFQLLGASLLLLVPELFSRERLTFARTWNVPLLGLGILVTGLNLWFVHVMLLEGGTYLAHAAVILGVYALLFAAHALHFRQPLLGYLSTASLALTVHYALAHFELDLWMPVLTGLAVAYYLAGYLLTHRDAPRSWGNMFIISGLALGALIAVIAGLTLKPTGGWYALVIAALFMIELYTRRNSNLEFPALSLISIALMVFLNDFKIVQLAYYLFGIGLIWLTGDAVFRLTLSHRNMGLITKGIGALVTFSAVFFIVINNDLASDAAAVCFAVYTAFFAAYALIHKTPALGYLSTAAASAATFYALDHFRVEAWMPAFTGLSLAYYIAGYLLRKRTAGWAETFRYSGLALGGLVSLLALVNLEAAGGWYAAVVGALFVVETVSSRNGWFEAGAYVPFSIAAFLVLNDFNIRQDSYVLLASSLVWLGGDVIFEKTFRERKAGKIVQFIGGGIAAFNAALLLLFSPHIEAAVCFGVYALLFGLYAWLYRQSLLGYAFTVSLPLSVFFAFRAANWDGWLFFALIVVAALYYTVSYFMRRASLSVKWDEMFLFSGLGLGTITALSAPFQSGGVENALPIAVAATLYAFEAFARKNIWLAFPANGLYLVSYFTILFRLEVEEPQFFSVGAAVLGMIMHYLLVRAKSKTGAFVMGMLSQLVLLGTTYIQMISTSELRFFFILFTQSLAVLVYGIVMRSRSLVIAPIGFAVLGVVTVLYSALKDLSVVFIIGAAGITLLTLGVLAVLMRERITTLAERFSDWNA